MGQAGNVFEYSTTLGDRSEKYSHVVAIVLLAVITSIGLALRLNGINTSLWLDELHTAWVVADGLGNLPPRALIGNHTPVFFSLPWSSVRLLGATEWSLRFPSLIAGTGLIPLVYLMILQWTGCRLGALLGGSLVALDPLCMFFSQEARVYAVLQFCAVLQVLVFWYVLQRPTIWNRSLNILGSALLWYLHYTSVWLFCAELVFYLLVATVKKRIHPYRLGKSVCDATVFLLLALPTIPHVIGIASRRANWERFVNVPDTWDLLTLFPLDLYVLLPAGLLGASFVWRVIAGRSPRLQLVHANVFVMTICWLFVPLVLAWLTSVTNVARLFFPRYLVIAYVALIVFAALTCTKMVGPWIRIVSAGLVVIVALVTHGTLGQFTRGAGVEYHGGEDWRSAIRWINDHDETRTAPLFVRSGLIEADILRDTPRQELRDYCLFPVKSLYGLEHSNRPLVPLPTSAAGQLTQPQLNSIRQGGGALFLVRGSHSDAKTIVKQVSSRLDQATTWQSEFAPFDGVTAIQMKRGE